MSTPSRAGSDEAYSIADAAKMLRVPQRTMRQAIARGRLIAYRPGPRRTFVYWSDVTDWHATRSPDRRADRARRAAEARWHPDAVATEDDNPPAGVDLQPVAPAAAAATQRLTHALLNLADQGGRPRCGEPATRDLWTSDAQAERALAVQHCAGCPVLTACGAAAEANSERFGVWAGVDRTRRPGEQTTVEAAA